MEWGDEQVIELVTILKTMAAALNVHQVVIQDMALALQALEARTLVTMSTYQGLSARLDKLEA